MEVYQIIVLLVILAFFALFYNDIRAFLNKKPTVAPADVEHQAIVDKRVEQLRLIYQQHLTSRDKNAALAAGRAYYSMKSSNGMNIYDEMAIQNDLNEIE